MNMLERLYVRRLLQATRDSPYAVHTLLQPIVRYSSSTPATRFVFLLYVIGSLEYTTVLFISRPLYHFALYWLVLDDEHIGYRHVT